MNTRRGIWNFALKKIGIPSQSRSVMPRNPCPRFCAVYEERITAPAPKQQIPFTWSSYEKASQICYTLPWICSRRSVRGHYSEHSLLPSLNKLSKSGMCP